LGGVSTDGTLEFRPCDKPTTLARGWGGGHKLNQGM
jgi:hypothetical protein